MPKISVIMGIYNSKSYDYLEKALKSILNQTYTDFELIICDDGSTNSCVSWAKEIVGEDTRVKFIKNSKNSGLAYTLNHCLEVATGEYIARMDDDDVSNLTRFEKQMDFVESHPEYDVVGTIADICDENDEIYGAYLLDEFVTSKSFLWNCPLLHPTIIAKKESLEKVGGYRVAKETTRYEDYDLFMRMYAKGMKMYNVQDKMLTYRMINDPKKKYRPMKVRLEEVVVRFKGYKEMGILIKGIPFIIKPIIVGLIPARLFAECKKVLFKEKKK